MRSTSIGLALGAVACFTLLGSLAAQPRNVPGGVVNGQVAVTIYVTFSDETDPYVPIGGFPITIYRGPSDSVALRTDEAGVVGFRIAPGAYRLVTPQPFAWRGANYRWNMPLIVRPGMDAIDLTPANAARAPGAGALARGQNGRGAVAPPARAGEVPVVVPGAGPVAPAGPPRVVRPGEGVVTSGAVPVRVPGRPQDVIAHARSNPTGFLFGLALTGAGLRMESSDTDPGGGLGLELGWGINDQIALFLRAAGTQMSPEGGGEGYALAHADLGVRVHLGGAESATRPWLEGAFTGRALRLEEFEINGSGGTIGIGLAHFFSPGAALTTGFAVTYGSFTEMKFDGETYDIDSKATSARLAVGLIWYTGR